MQLTPEGEASVQALAQRYGVSIDAVRTLLSAVSAGGGTMAQFYHPELGGSGQWMRGGMTMVGDMFNSSLQSTVSGLCAELSSLLASRPVFAPLPSPAFGPGSSGGFGTFNNWWPAELGSPSSSGSQNDARYAYFPHAQRLAIERNGAVTVYDTLNHQIGGVQQQQGGSVGSLSFSSQFGTFTVESLPIVSGGSASRPRFDAAPPMSPPSTSSPSSTENPQSSSEVLNALERLGTLHSKGILSDEEFRSKKAELLARL
jgi:hypothetical protein